MTEPVFKEWPKIARLNRDVVITEKIDGTNACVIVDENGEVFAQSRSRIITPEEDNHGFAKWVKAHASELEAVLGVGYHFGEWWGNGIQRGYGLAKGDKRFSLFDVSRWADHEAEWARIGLGTVPVLWRGNFDTEMISNQLTWLKEHGSLAVIGYKNPEGLVVYHMQGNVAFKVTIENDDVPKGQVK